MAQDSHDPTDLDLARPLPVPAASAGTRPLASSSASPCAMSVVVAEHLLFAGLGLVMLPHVNANIANYQKAK